MTDVIFRSDVKAELVDWMGDEQSIVRTARVSTLGASSASEKADKGLVRFLYREGHGTPFESNVATFRFEIPIFVSRQIVKHRISSINEESGRYKELEPMFYIPGPDIKLGQQGKTGDYDMIPLDPEEVEEDVELLKELYQYDWNFYERLLGRGWSKESAREVLPVSLFSTIYMTANLRSWLNFVSLRTPDSGSHPQQEIAMLGYQVADVIKERVPSVWQAFVESDYKAV